MKRIEVIEGSYLWKWLEGMFPLELVPREVEGYKIIATEFEGKRRFLVLELANSGRLLTEDEMTVFNAEQFASATVEAANSTRQIPIQDGEWNAQVSKLTFRNQKMTDGTERIICDVAWEIQDDQVKSHTKLEKPIARQSLFLDVTEQGALDMSEGKNVQLGRLREAVNQNKAGKRWAFNMLHGMSAVVRTKQATNKDDPDNPFVNVVAVTSARGTRPKAAE